jgi:hypothetical protein
MYVWGLLGNAGIEPGVNEVAEVEFPAGKMIASGGFTLDDNLVLYFSSISGVQWRAYAYNTGIHTQGLISPVVCLGKRHSAGSIISQQSFVNSTLFSNQYPG